MSGEPVSSLATLDFLTHRRRATTFCFFASIFRKKLLAASMTPTLQIVWRFWQCFRREVLFNLESTKTKCDGLSSLPFVTCIVFGVAFRSDHRIYSKQGFGCSIIGIFIFHSPLCIEIASAQKGNSSHVVGFAGPHLDPSHKDLEQSWSASRCARLAWEFEQLAKATESSASWYSRLVQSCHVSKRYSNLLFFIPFLHDHDWSTVERVYQVHVF